MSLPQIQRALRSLEREFPSAHPLADHQFQTSRAEFLVEKFGEILSMSRRGQVEMRELLHAYLQCVEWDDHGVPVKLDLPSLKPSSVERGVIIIDPRISFGRPVLDGTGIRAEIIVERFPRGRADPIPGRGLWTAA